MIYRLINGVMKVSEEEARVFLEQVREVARKEAQEISKNYVKIVPGYVISVSGKTATVQLSIGGATFTAPIVTSQTISSGDSVNIAYWSNLSTAIVLSK